jgi:hypothetical protein
VACLPWHMPSPAIEKATPAMCEASMSLVRASRLERSFISTGSHCATRVIDPSAMESEYSFCRLLVRASIACVSTSMPHVAVG